MNGEASIIKNSEVLISGFIPERVIHREGQIKTLRDDLLPLLNGNQPRNAFLWGDPGTGKTVLSRYLLSELKKEIPND